MPRKTWRHSRKDYPEGVVAVLDNGGRSLDRYLVVYEPTVMDVTLSPPYIKGALVFPILAMNAWPTHPQGIGMHFEVVGHRPTAGWGTGQKVIRFEDLPEECQMVVRYDLEEDAKRKEDEDARIDRS